MKSRRPSSAPKRFKKPVVNAPPAPRKAIKRLRSKIAGWGVYALEPITKNSRIVDYAGQLITWKESDRRELKHGAMGCIWCFVLKRGRWCVDASVGGNIARFVNHSCTPNCYTQVIDNVIWIRAARNIKRGEELTYDYETGGGMQISCRCRPNCKTQI
jgi:SET domain-containing protein